MLDSLYAFLLGQPSFVRLFTLLVQRRRRDGADNIIMLGKVVNGLDYIPQNIRRYCNNHALSYY